MLVADAVSREAGGRRIVDGVSAAFAPGKLSLIVGPNGAGKSTLLKLLSGQLHPSSGAIRYGDVPLAAMRVQELARVRAILSQSLDLAFPLRVREVVMMGRYPHFSGAPGEEDERACDEVMRLFEVDAMERRDMLTLSGGEQQRVHFARVLAQLWSAPKGATRYLFLDEPLTFLDVHYQFELMHKLRALLHRDLAIVGVLHDLNLAARFADELLLLHEGRVLAAGTRERVLTAANIELAFRIKPRILRDGAETFLVF